MNNKIKKISRILFIFLVVALPIGSFSSIASVGSDAFVSKEEFDLALSDFNKRLTNFEAGINSKIDSQVTSYLDRNGIWSAQLQAFSDVNLGNTGMTTDTANRWGTRWYVNSAGNWANSTTTSGKNVIGYKTADKDVFAKIGKSGLMMFGFRGDKAGANINVAPGNTNSTASKEVPSDNVTLQFTEILEFWQTYTEKGATVEEYLYGVSVPAIVPVPGMIMMQNYPSTIINFFVRKDAKLTIKFKVDSIAVNTVAWSANTIYHKWIGESANVY